jgi:hypothetical protein
MSRIACHAATGTFLESYDFDHNYQHLKKLIQDLKIENDASVKQELFGETESERMLTKKQMKQLFRFLRKVETHYKECCEPPIPDELEQSIRAKNPCEWLPWESEAIEKVDSWRSALTHKQAGARQMLDETLERFREAE